MKVLERIEQEQETNRLVLDKILFATDFSPASEVALRYALVLARRYHSKIYIIPAAATDTGEALARDARQTALHKSRTRALSWVAELGVSGELNGVRYEIPDEAGEKALSGLLKGEAFDVAINGIGCREGHVVLLEPSVEEVLRRSECPVITIGRDSHGAAEGKVNSIIYATDFSAESLEASRYALSLAQEFQARLTLLHVVEGWEPTLLGERARIAKPYKLWLSKLVPDEARLWCDLEFVVEFGRPAERILQVAWESHADLVVVGARGLERLTSPGLNVRKVICNASCPVLSVSGTLAPHRQERFWRAAASASGSQQQEILEILKEAS